MTERVFVRRKINGDCLHHSVINFPSFCNEVMAAINEITYTGEIKSTATYADFYRDFTRDMLFKLLHQESPGFSFYTDEAQIFFGPKDMVEQFYKELADCSVPENVPFTWKYKESERPKGACYDCKKTYGTFPDGVVADHIWEYINPTYLSGCGILCPTCIAVRCKIIGLGEVQMTIHSGGESPESKLISGDGCPSKVIAS